MTTDRDLRIANARQIVLHVLGGALTPESDPAAFDDDAVYISVRIVEQNEPEWLLEIIANADSERGGIERVLDCLGPLRQRADARLARNQRNR